MDRLATAIRKAVEQAPCSARRVAIEAGIDPSLLTRILAGERNATPEVADMLADALARWQARCKSGEEIIRKELER